MIETAKTSNELNKLTTTWNRIPAWQLQKLSPHTFRL